MPTTTNYGWTTPADTDLVKDGASAIRTLGTAIDTTVFNNASAAIAKTIVDAKGDIIAATAADTVARLAVGTNGQYLAANSSTATGLEWQTVTAGGMTLLSSGSIGSSGIDLTSISSSYEELKLKLMDFDVSTACAIFMRLNNDSGSNYYNVKLRGQNSTGGTDAAGGTTYLQINYDTLSATANGAIAIVNLPNYHDTTGYKVTNFTLNNVDNSTANASTYGQGFWKNENAIDRITINLTAGTFDAGTYELWGMK
jgi:hypothetical protein